MQTEPERIRTADLEHEDGFRFTVHFSPEMPALVVDEPPPLGTGSGPEASRLLAAAVGNCLSASLLLCLQKSHVNVRDLRSHVELTLSRNEKGRLRVTGGVVRITLSSDGEGAKLDRCTRMFEDYCIVTATVRRAFPIFVEVVDAEGHELYHSGEEIDENRTPVG